MKVAFTYTNIQMEKEEFGQINLNFPFNTKILVFEFHLIKSIKR